MYKLSIALVFSLLGAVFGAAFIPSDWESRIVGGTEATPGQFPYMVSLRTSANSHYCGGWIHNSRWVVSAAHCTVGRTTDNVIVAVAAHTRTDGTVYASTTVVNHPNYNSNTINNDISCVQTVDSIVFNDRVATIALGDSLLGGGVPSVKKGWGVTSQGGTGSEVLMYLNTATITNDECISGLGSGAGSMIFDNKICTINDPGQGSCQMDSGGPVTVGNTVAGAVSWGIGCANGLPDVNERVFSHLDWLLTTMI